jgi:hypothetical protein
MTSEEGVGAKHRRIMASVIRRRTNNPALHVQDGCQLSSCEQSANPVFILSPISTTQFSLGARILHRPRRLPVIGSGNETDNYLNQWLIACRDFAVGESRTMVGRTSTCSKDADQLYLHPILASPCDWCEVKILALGVTEPNSLLTSTGPN